MHLVQKAPSIFCLLLTSLFLFLVFCKSKKTRVEVTYSPRRIVAPQPAETRIYRGLEPKKLCEIHALDGVLCGYPALFYGAHNYVLSRHLYLMSGVVCAYGTWGFIL